MLPDRHLRPSLALSWTLMVFLCGLATLRADKLTIAAASNLTYALPALDAAYLKANPGDTIDTVLGSSGSLFAQIKNGAPIDLFLAADTDYPKKLADEGAAEAATLATFATGRLALWTMNPAIDVSDIGAALVDPRVKHIAIANPRTAPYGRAARQTLAELELWEKIQPKLVTGDNISQTAQFVETGNADVGFVALSLMLSPKNKNKGTYHEVPPEFYEPLDQGAVITKHGAANAAAKRYLAFLKTRAARDVLEHFGYDVPLPF